MLRWTALACLLISASSFAQELAPRQPLRVTQVKAAALPAGVSGTLESPGPAGPSQTNTRVAEHRLIVKFQDAVLARADQTGELLSQSGQPLAAVKGLAVDLGTTLRFRPLLRTAPDQLESLRSRAAQRSGRAQPDLAGMLIVELPNASSEELERVGQALNELEEVEWSWIELTNPAPPGDLAPTTPSLVTFQNYRGPNPGIDVDYAWSVGARGQNVRLSDCEYGWDPDHEDLNDISLHLEPGQTISAFVFSNGWDDHGTAALGEVAAQSNAYGCSGIAPDAEMYTWPENSVQEGSRRVTCITNAIAASATGDVVMLEMQTSSGGGYGPAELNPAVWTVCKVGTDAGVVVVGAAGNGNENLDSSLYATYQSWGHSGAIIVGAGSSNTSHSKLSFSTYGNRVDVQGWGQSVFTLGYGHFNSYGGDPHQSYTSSFSGTSSATPFVAGACVALQSYIKGQGAAPLDSQELRNLLVSTGIPQGSGGHIGPFPDLRAAITALSTCPPPQSYCGTTPNSAGAGALMSWSGSTNLWANDGIVQVDGAPPGIFGLFFFGSGETAVPLGDGQLCVDGGGQGLIRLNPATATDVLGGAQVALDYNQFPLNSGPGQVMAGQTARWQFWYRDPAAGGAGFNLSNGLRVTYCP